MANKELRDAINKTTNRGFILVKQEDSGSIIADPVSGGMLLYNSYEEAEAWAQEVSNRLGSVIVIEPIDVTFLPKEEEEDPNAVMN